MVRGQAPVATSPTWTTVTAPQLSVAVTAAGLGAGTSAGHCTVTGGGQVMAGGTVSVTMIVWVQVAILPQASVAVHRRVMVLGQAPLLVSVKLTGKVPPQLSVAVTVGGAGTVAGRSA